MCCFNGHCPKGGGGAKACQDALEHFFPRLPGGARARQDALEHVCPFDSGEGV